MSKKVLPTSATDKPTLKSMKLSEDQTSSTTASQTYPAARKFSSNGVGSFNIDNLLQVPNLSQADKSRSYVESLQKAGLMWPVLNTPASITQPMGFIIPQQAHLLSVPQPVSTDTGSIKSYKQTHMDKHLLGASEDDDQRGVIEVV